MNPEGYNVPIIEMLPPSLVFLLVLPVDTNRRPRKDLSTIEWFSRLNGLKCCCPDRFGSGSSAGSSGSSAGSSGSSRIEFPFETNQSDSILNIKSSLKHDLKRENALLLKFVGSFSPTRFASNSYFYQCLSKLVSTTLSKTFLAYSVIDNSIF